MGTTNMVGACLRILDGNYHYRPRVDYHNMLFNSIILFLHRIDAEDVYLPENPNYIIRLLIRQRTRYLRTEDLEGTATDAQFTRKLLLYLYSYCLADQHALRLRSTFQDACQVKYQSRKYINIKCFTHLDLD